MVQAGDSCVELTAAASQRITFFGLSHWPHYRGMDFGPVKQLISGGGIAIDRDLSSNVQLESILSGDENTEVDRAVINSSFR